MRFLHVTPKCDKKKVTIESGVQKNNVTVSSYAMFHRKQIKFDKEKFKKYCVSTCSLYFFHYIID